MMRLLVLCLNTFLLLMLFSTAVYADDSQPLTIQIKERQTNYYQINVRVPPTLASQNTPQLVMPAFCRSYNDTGPLIGSINAGHQLYQCSNTLQGQRLSVQYPYDLPALSTVIKYQSSTGELHTKVLRPGELDWQVPIGESPSQVAKDYTGLGIIHIWQGTDHLLFLLCLLWIAGSAKRVLITVTGFTLAHSITLVLSALEIIRLSIKPVEAVIALSIVFLATEIVKDRRNTFTWRYPIAVSSSFGLIHGLGFAAVLTEIGLPQIELYTGLLFFNIGVEIGQIVFVVCALSLLVATHKLVKLIAIKEKLMPMFRTGTAYMVGSTASFWLIERLV